MNLRNVKRVLPALGLVLAWALPARAEPIWYYVENENSGLVLDVSGAKAAPGAEVHVYHRKHKQHDNQLWTITSDGFIQSKLGGNLVLDIKGGATQGNLVQVYTKKPADNLNQKWQVTNDGFVQNKSGLVLDIKQSDGPTHASSRVGVWLRKDDKDIANQHWKLVRADQVPARVDPNAFFYIQNITSGLVLDIAGGKTTPGTEVHVYTKKPSAESANQLWKVTADGFIVSKAADVVLDINSPADAQPGALLVIGARNPASPKQKWLVTTDGFIHSDAGPFVLDIKQKDGPTHAGSKVGVWNRKGFNENGNQRWRLVADIPPPPPPLKVAFKPVPGQVSQISVGKDGSVWAIGVNAEGGGHGIYRWNSTTWVKWPGAAVRIATAPDGSAWVVNASHGIFHWENSGWKQIPGAATDIAVGANGAVYVIGWNARPDHDIWQWANNRWVHIGGLAARIAVGPQGDPWVVTAAGAIFHREQNRWVLRPGHAHMVSVGANGDVIAAQRDGRFSKWTGKEWQLIDGANGTEVAVGPRGEIWGKAANNSLATSAAALTVPAFAAPGALAVPPPPPAQAGAAFHPLPGLAEDIGVGANGVAWVIGADRQPGGFSIHRFNGRAWDRVAGAAIRISVDPHGNPWIVNDKGNIFHWNGRGWTGVPGLAHDIGVGANGAVWVIGFGNLPGNNHSIHQWNGRSWNNIPGGAVRVAVGPRGEGYVVNAEHQIFQWNGKSWNTLPGAANDISVGPDGSIIVSGNDNVPGGHTLWRWNGRGWTNLGGAGVNVAAGPKGEVWTTNATHNILRGGGAAAAVTVVPPPVRPGVVVRPR